MLLLALAACGFSNLPNQDDVYVAEPLWDPAGVVATVDGLYTPLTKSGGLALVRTDGTYTQVDLGDAVVSSLSLAPDQQTLAVASTSYSCKVYDPDVADSIQFLEDCDTDLRVTHHQIQALQNGSVVAVASLEGPYDALRWSDDSRFAVAWPDVANLDGVSGVVNLTSVVVIDATTGDANTIPVGFAASDVLFSASGETAVVLSQNSVAVLDLTTSPPSRSVTFPLTLDPDQVVTPVGVALTPDARYALISTGDSSDLYILDLEQRSVNMVSLSGIPSAMYLDGEHDRTLFVYGNRARVDVVEHEYFDLESTVLDEPMATVSGASDFVLLSAPGRRDVYAFDPDSKEVVEFRLQSPLLDVSVSPTEEFAVAFTVENGYGSRPGMEVLDLRDGRGRSFPYLLESRGTGLAFDAFGSSLHALVLQEGVNYVYSLDLYTAQNEQIDLAATPVGIGSMPAGGFFVTHDEPLGFVSFLDPTTGNIRTVSGFAALGIIDPVRVTVEAQ